jgi:hypothetical protein
MNRISYFLWMTSLVVSMAACSGSQAKQKQTDPLLAKVHNKSLYLSEMEGMFPEGITAEDSNQIISLYAQQWIKEALLLHEAERNIPNDLNIDKLVRDYRASLIRHNYEQMLVENGLDSIIAQDELIEFYEQNKEQYQLETPIVRCYFLKVPLPVSDEEQLRSLWNSDDPDDIPKLTTYCNMHAASYLLDKDSWHKVEDIAQEMPKGTITTDNISAKKEFSQRDEQYQYYFRLFEVKNRKDIAPLSYIAEQASKVILRARKEKLLAEKIEAMYEKELSRNNIHTYY